MIKMEYIGYIKPNHHNKMRLSSIAFVSKRDKITKLLCLTRKMKHGPLIWLQKWLYRAQCIDTHNSVIHSHTIKSGLYALPVIITWLSLLLLLWLPVSDACYAYPAGMKNPCKGVECQYGAYCVPSNDGNTYRCQVRQITYPPKYVHTLQFYKNLQFFCAFFEVLEIKCVEN
jgi:hypothetical protein